MIEPACDRCHRKLSEFGALYLGPPNAEGLAMKRHICVACIPIFEALFTIAPVTPAIVEANEPQEKTG